MRWLALPPPAAACWVSVDVVVTARKPHQICALGGSNQCAGHWKLGQNHSVLELELTADASNESRAPGAPVFDGRRRQLVGCGYCRPPSVHL